MGEIYNERYELIREIDNDELEGVYLVRDIETRIEYIMNEIFQETSSSDNEILKREFRELIMGGITTMDTGGIAPIIKDFFIENDSKYMIIDFEEEEDALEWIQAFPSIGCIFKSCYVVVRGVAAGGFGIVYQVKDANIPGKYWALKEMYDDSDKPDVVKRSFKREAEILAGLKHPSIPVIVSFFTDEARHYLIMEYIDGHTLEDMIDNLDEEEYFPEEAILDWGIQVSEVLEYLHNKPQAVVFRDMKPDNIMIMKDGGFKLIDFGISCVFEGPRGKTTLHTLLSEGYAPQEQWLGKAEPRSDIYSLGATLHHLATKLHPREVAPDFPPPDQLNSLISRELALVILKALEPKMIDRYQTVREMKEALLDIIEKRKAFQKEIDLLLQGESYEEESNYFEAISEYMKVLEINSESEKASYRLACCYEKLGFKEKALDNYKKALTVALSPDIKEDCEEKVRFYEGKEVEDNLGVSSARMMEEIQAITAKNIKIGSYLSPKDFRLTTKFGHTSSVTSVCFIPGKKCIASASKDKTIKLWDIEKEKLICNLEGHLDGVNSICATPDGEWLVSGSADKTAKLWEFKNKTLAYVFGGFQDEVKVVTISPDGKKLACGSGHYIHLLDLELKSLVVIFEGHRDNIKTLVFSPDSKFLFSSDSASTIRLWDLECRKVLYSFDSHNDTVRALSISPEGDIMAVAMGDKISIVDIGTKQILSTLEGSKARIETLTLDPSGINLAAGDSEGNLTLWNIENSEYLFTLQGHRGWISSIRWNKDGDIILSGSSDNSVKLWSFKEQKLLYTFAGHHTGIETMILSPDGKFLATANSDNTIKIWSLRNCSLVNVMEKHKQIVTALSYSPDCKYLASGSWDETVTVWDMDKKEPSAVIEAGSGLIGATAFTFDGKLFATGGSDNTIKLWHTLTGELVKSFEGPDWAVEAIDFSPDGKWMASGGSNNTITIWDMKRGEELECLTDHKDSVLCISFGPHSKMLVSGSKDNSVKLWLLEGKKLFSRNITKKLVHTFEGHNASVLSVCFDNQGKRIASGGKDNTVNIWDIESCELLFSFSGHSSAVTSLSFSPDDKFIYSASKDGSIKIWDLEEKSLSFTLIALNKEGNYEYIAFAPDNSYNCSEGGKEHIIFEKIMDK